ncbi:hypothetical protein RHMOL_Rhmol03G0127300 [Rhododendron molle]|uniref:Uncharacterized protein n=1 Tax=Rhododendron molle TaxID=49168 RepID=A0ACC0PE10_RHOML|nr:hypothetical protein RHMOL_Rhmol03G0127300 [Rhododendron molle]
MTCENEDEKSTNAIKSQKSKVVCDILGFVFNGASSMLIGMAECKEAASGIRFEGLTQGFSPIHNFGFSTKGLVSEMIPKIESGNPKKSISAVPLTMSLRERSEIQFYDRDLIASESEEKLEDTEFRLFLEGNFGKEKISVLKSSVLAIGAAIIGCNLLKAVDDYKPWGDTECTKRGSVWAEGGPTSSFDRTEVDDAFLDDA